VGLRTTARWPSRARNADIHGDVSLTAGSRVVTSGAGSVTTFYDDVVHNGLEIYTGAGASSVFFGAGPFTGTGNGRIINSSASDIRRSKTPIAVATLADSPMISMQTVAENGL
jgi:hypothetical protein